MNDDISIALKRAGFSTALALLSSFPNEGYEAIVRRLPGVLPIQLIRCQYAEAKEFGQVQRVARDHLRRVLVEGLPKGWPSDPNAWSLTHALAAWSSEIVITGENPELESAAMGVANALRMASPGEGWLPNGPDDPVLSEAFQRHWPAEK